MDTKCNVVYWIDRPSGGGKTTYLKRVLAQYGKDTLYMNDENVSDTIITQLKKSDAESAMAYFADMIRPFRVLLLDNMEFFAGREAMQELIANVLVRYTQEGGTVHIATLLQSRYGRLDTLASVLEKSCTLVYI